MPIPHTVTASYNNQTSLANSQPLVTDPKTSPGISRKHTEHSIALSAHASEMQPEHSRHNRTRVLRSPTQPTAAHQPVTLTLSVALPVSFRTVSRPVELSLQSSFKLSFTVLVYYRSHGNI